MRALPPPTLMRDPFTTRSDPPLPEEYSRITNPERLRPLHSRAERLLERLQRDHDVTRRETFDMLPGMTPFDRLVFDTEFLGVLRSALRSPRSRA